MQKKIDSALICVSSFVFLALFASGCSPVASTKIKYQSQKEVLLETLEHHPKEVILNGGDAIVANQRLGILFSREFKVKGAITKNKASNVSSWNAGTENLIIKVTHRLVSSGHLYVVDVVPRTVSFAEEADLAARNIARYIKTGIFERSLFDK
jgi:hypothetical protein